MQVAELVNRERENNGLPPLAYRSDLQPAADTRASELVSVFSHTRPDGSSCFTAIDESISYLALGENIAYGHKNAETVVTGWMNSPGHRANILSDSFTGIAVGLVSDGGTKYWVQLFIG